MKINLLQTDITWCDATDNILKAEQLIAQAPSAQVYCLPEMWSTGFVMEPDGIAPEENDSIALEWMRQKAKSLNAALCGSLAIKAVDGTFRNRNYFVHPSGEIDFYDKHHLFKLGGENAHYQTGKQPIVVDFLGWRWLLLTCYDLRFPAWSRYGGVAGAYDGIIYVANWPRPRADVWEVLLRARAIENQCYVIGVNRVGHDPLTDYAGGSMVVNYKGQVICKGGEGEVVLSADLSLDNQQSFRKRFNTLCDRDNLFGGDGQVHI